MGLDSDPYRVFQSWFSDAVATGMKLPEAMTLATASKDGGASARIVLYKGLSGRRLRFFTNLGSRKAAELAANPHAALCFWWREIDKQVRITGPVEQLSNAEADEYFASRPRESQLGAWASDQSRPIADRAALDAAFAAVEKKFEGREVSRPSGWGGYGLWPETFEFWIHGASRLHDRFSYRRDGEGWKVERLAP